MAKGDTSPSEPHQSEDPVTGVTITRLTDHKAHSHHTYFTNPGWYDEGRSLLFASDRGNATKRYSMDLASTEFHQLTALPDAAQAESNLPHSTTIHPTRAHPSPWPEREPPALLLPT